jgi:hypothetical protein
MLRRPAVRERRNRATSSTGGLVATSVGFITSLARSALSQIDRDRPAPAAEKGRCGISAIDQRVKFPSSFDAIYTRRRMNLNGGFTWPLAIYSKELERLTMLDLVYVVVALGAFALFALSVDGCERL